jgi:hypothetical protein
LTTRIISTYETAEANISACSCPETVRKAGQPKKCEGPVWVVVEVGVEVGVEVVGVEGDEDAEEAADGDVDDDDGDDEGVLVGGQPGVFTAEVKKKSMWSLQ